MKRVALTLVFICLAVWGIAADPWDLASASLFAVPGDTALLHPHERVAPELAISVTESTVLLNWSSVPGAASYKVYSSPLPGSGFDEDTSGVFDGTSWTAANLSDRRYYYATAVLGPSSEFNLALNAFDFDWFNNNGYTYLNPPPFNDPHDINAEIWYQAQGWFDPAFTGMYTPYLFGAPGNLPFVAGIYSVRKDGWDSVMVMEIELDPVANYSWPFLMMYMGPD